MRGALLIDKPQDLTSFGVIERLQKAEMQRLGVKKKDLPKLGHGGTLDPFATGLLLVCTGEAVKLARYFLGSRKGYRGVIRFGETTIPGDPTAPISATTDTLPTSLKELQDLAERFCAQPYLQIPPMHSAKKVEGKPLYELARKGIEIDRDPKLCHLYEFKILSYQNKRAEFEVLCSAGTYIRTLAQDFGKLAGSLALLESLSRFYSGGMRLTQALPLSTIEQTLIDEKRSWETLSCFIPFDELLIRFNHLSVTDSEALGIIRGQKRVLHTLLQRLPEQTHLEPLINEGQECIPLFYNKKLLAVIRNSTQNSKLSWDIDRVFMEQTPRFAPPKLHPDFLSANLNV